jgi:hypothetical protein
MDQRARGRLGSVGGQLRPAGTVLPGAAAGGGRLGGKLARVTGRARQRGLWS